MKKEINEFNKRNFVSYLISAAILIVFSFIKYYREKENLKDITMYIIVFFILLAIMQVVRGFLTKNQFAKIENGSLEIKWNLNVKPKKVTISDISEIKIDDRLTEIFINDFDAKNIKIRNSANTIKLNDFLRENLSEKFKSE